MNTDNLVFHRITDKEPTNPEHSNNGGDYWFFRVLAIDEKINLIVGFKYETSAEFSYCSKCGNFYQFEHDNCSGGLLDKSTFFIIPSITQITEEREIAKLKKEFERGEFNVSNIYKHLISI